MPDYKKLEDMPVEESRLLPHDHPLIDDYAHRINEQRGFPTHLLNGIKNGGEQSESKGDRSVSPKGAQGIMQFMPATAKQYGLKDRTDPRASIDAAADYVAEMQKALKTSDPGVLSAGYNGGFNRESLRNGIIPQVPEMQNHAKRTVAYMDNKNGFVPDDELTPEQLARQKAWVAPASVQTPMPENNLTPEQQAREAAWKADQQANINAWKTDRSARENARLLSLPIPKEYSPLSSSTLENSIAGAQKGLLDSSKGLGQSVYDFINGASNLAGKGDLLNRNTFSTDESSRLDRPLAENLGGGLSNAVANGLSLALPTSALAKANKVRETAQLLGKIPVVGGALGKLFPASVASGVVNATSPIQSDEGLGTRAINAVVGASAPALLHGLGVMGRDTASVLGNTQIAKDIASGARTVGNALTPDFAKTAGNYVGKGLHNLYDAIAPTAISKPNDAKTAAVESAIKNDIPVYPNQLKATTEALPLGRDQHAKQADAFARAVIKNDLGQESSSLAEALPLARKQASENYEKIYGGKQIPVGNSVPGLKQLENNYLNDSTSRFDAFKNSGLAKKIVADAITAAGEKPVLTGKEMQDTMGMYKAILRDIDNTKNPKGETDRHAAAMVHAVIDSLSGSANKVLSPDEQALLKQTNNIWRNTHQLEPILQDNLHGVVSPTKYAKEIRDANPNSFVYGNGNQEQNNLAKFGSTYMTDSPLAKEGVPLLTTLANHPIAATVLGGLAGHVLDKNENDSSSHLGAILGSTLLGRGASKLGRSTVSATQRMLPHELYERTGPLSEVFGRGNVSNALAKTANTISSGYPGALERTMNDMRKNYEDVPMQAP